MTSITIAKQSLTGFTTQNFVDEFYTKSEHVYIIFLQLSHISHCTRPGFLASKMAVSARAADGLAQAAAKDDADKLEDG